MRQLLILLSLLGLLTGCEGTLELGDNADISAIADATDPSSTQVVSPAAQLDGGVLFQTHCGACHGMDATGGTSFPTSILGYAPISTVVTQGSGTMPAIALQQAEIAAIQGFLTKPSATPVAPTEEGSSPGLTVYAQQCAGCHGVEGVGAAGGPPVRLRDPGLVRFTVRQGRNGPDNPTTMPVYNRDAISDAQLDEMIDWLDSFPNPPDGAGLYAQYCANCHGAEGGGGTSFEPVAGVLRAQTIIRAGHGAQRYIERSEYMPAWDEDQISDAEIVLIEQYLRTL